MTAYSLVLEKVLTPTGKLSIPFLVKLTENIVSVREWLNDDTKPVLHHALVFTLLDYFEADKISIYAAFIEKMISEDLEFKILNK